MIGLNWTESAVKYVGSASNISLVIQGYGKGVSLHHYSSALAWAGFWPQSWIIITAVHLLAILSSLTMTLPRSL